MACKFEDPEGLCIHHGRPKLKQYETGGCMAVDNYDECDCFTEIDYQCEECGADFSIGEECGCHEYFCPDCLNHEDDCEC